MKQINHPLLSLTRALVPLIYNLWSHPETTEDAPICQFCDNSTARFVTGDNMLKLMRRMAEVIEADEIGVSPEGICVHSVHSGAAIAILLDSTPIFLIMLVGRGSSDAFLKHIRKKFLEAAKGISSRMLKNDMLCVLPSPLLAIDKPLNLSHLCQLSCLPVEMFFLVVEK